MGQCSKDPQAYVTAQPNNQWYCPDLKLPLRVHLVKPKPYVLFNKKMYSKTEELESETMMCILKSSILLEYYQH